MKGKRVTPLELAASPEGTGALAFVRPGAALDGSRLIDTLEAQCLAGLDSKDFAAAVADGQIREPLKFIIGGREIVRFRRQELLRDVWALAGTSRRRRSGSGEVE